MDRLTVKVAIGGAFASLVLAMVLVPGLKAAGPRDPDVLMQVLGGTAELASEKAYSQADIYFHGGMDVACSDHEHHDHEDDHDCGHDDHSESDLLLIGVIRHMHGEMSPRSHRHLSAEEEKELLPWFTAAVRLNPRNIEAWRTGAYWFFRTGDPGQAVEFISEGIRHNPREYRLFLDRAILHHRAERWAEAVDDLESAERLWKNNCYEADVDLRAIHRYIEHVRGQLSGI